MDPATERFVERMGRHFEADRVPRIGGRLFGYLLLQDEPKTLEDLADALQVSKASVSTNARMLEQWGLLERVTRPGDRRDFYIASADQTRTLELRLERFREWSTLLREACETLPSCKPAARQRLETMLESTDEMLERFVELIDRRRSAGVP